MITYHFGDLLESNCKIICHQVNLQGFMGGGLALQISKKYPMCEEKYKKYLNLYYLKNEVLGKVHFFKSEDGTVVANCFSQKENFDTDYEALKSCLNRIKKYALICGKGTSVGIPFKYGCGIANGDWEKVEKIIKFVFEKSNVDCQIWRI